MEEGFIEYEGWDALMKDETLGQRRVHCAGCKASLLLDDSYDAGDVVVDGKYYVKPYCKECWEKIRPRMKCARCGITEDDPRIRETPWYPIAYNDEHLFKGSICKACIVALVEKCWCDYCVHRKLDSKYFKQYFNRDAVLDHVLSLRNNKK